MTDPEPYIVLDRCGDQPGHELLVQPSAVTAIEENGDDSLIRVAGRGYLVIGPPRKIADLLGSKVAGAVRPAPLAQAGQIDLRGHVGVDGVDGADVDRLERFLAGGPLADPSDAIGVLCTLRSIVVHSGATDWPGVADDCICDRIKIQNWRSDGQGIRFIITATLSALGLAVAA